MTERGFADPPILGVQAATLNDSVLLASKDVSERLTPEISGVSRSGFAAMPWKWVCGIYTLH